MFKRLFKRRERIRSTRIRSKVAVLLASLVALWAFAAWVTTREGLDLLTVNQSDQQIGRPTNALVTQLQEERRLSMIFLGAPSPQSRAALQAQRSRTDRANSRFARQGRNALNSTGSDDTKRQLRAMFDLLGGLNTIRFTVDNGGGGRGPVADAYNRIADGAFALYADNSELDDHNLAREGRALIAMEHAKEFVAREDSLLEGALASGRFSAADRLQFTELVGQERLLQSQAAADLPDPDRPRYAQLVAGPAVKDFRRLEDRITRFQGNAPVPVAAGEWTRVVRPVIAGLEHVVLAGGDDVVKSAKPVAIGVIARLALAGGLGLAAVIASIVVSITTVRDLSRQLRRLRRAAWELASERLPSVVERLGRGEKVIVEEEAPPLSFGEDEVGQVGRAFNSVQETAIRTAVEQAELRRNFREILLSLARRSQTMLHRQLNLLDEMERREEDAADLDDLFRVDHLATRMRRNAENLIVLSGATPARGWRRPVPMIDVVRSAVAEVEDYTRVEVAALDEIALSGHAVGDVVHLLAELIENAVSFSPPDTQAHVSGRRAARGYAIEIEDRGLGMTDELLETINQRVSESTEFNLAGSTHLGLYVVGRLAERYDVRVSLKHSSYGGTTAVVLIPQNLIEDVPEDGDTLDRIPSPVPAMTSGSPGSLTMVRDAPAKVVEAERTDGDPPALPQRRRTRPEVENGTTPGGLPVRKPQASLAPALRTDENPAAEEKDEGPGRSPAEIRKSIGGLQASTRRARSEAARAKEAEEDD